jgi:hypothetical protein
MDVTRHGFHYISVGRSPMTPVHPPSTANDTESFAGVER